MVYLTNDGVVASCTVALRNDRHSLFGHVGRQITQHVVQVASCESEEEAAFFR